MSVEILCSFQVEVPIQLKVINGFGKPCIESFGSLLEAVKAPSLDQRIPKSEVVQALTVIKNLQPISSPPEPEFKSLHPSKEAEGQLFVCDVRLYRNLYNEYLQFFNGDKEPAKRNVLLAVIKDGTALVQENISSLKDKNGNLEVDDTLIQAKMQQTPTVHYLYNVTNPSTENGVITSPEYVDLGKSITSALTNWRRGNDKAVIGLVEELVVSLPGNENREEEKPDYTFFWASPKAEDWENERIRKYNGEYGYQYVGHLTKEEGMRQLTVYSFKVDASTDTHASFMKGLGGESYTVPFRSPEETERPFLDKLMRTVTVVKGSISNAEVISGLYRSKKEVEGTERMFGILEETMHFIQDPFLRERVETEVSAPVARWMVEQIENGVSDSIIQSQVRDKYIEEVKALVARIKDGRANSHSVFTKLDSSPRNIAPDSTVYTQNMNALFMQDLRGRTQTVGGFCGDWGSSSYSSGLSSNPLQDLKNYTGVSGMRSSVFKTGSVASTVINCRKCGEETCESKCYKCKIDYKKTA